MENHEELLNLIKEHHDFLQRLKAEEPYSVNILDNVRILENDHTKILLDILRYQKNEHYVILNSFLELIGKECEENPFVTIQNITPQIDFNREYIDGLIEFPRKYGIIIENKINYAVDQYKQIERYICTIQNHGIPNENIYVVYLTLNGEKEVSDISFTEEAKKILADGKRFISIDYKHHILPWLQSLYIVIDNQEKEKLLTATIELYIDYLKGRFNQRTNQQKTNNNMANYLEKQLHIGELRLSDKLKSIENTMRSVNEINNTLSYLKEKYLNEIFENFNSITIDYWRQQQFEVSLNNKVGDGYYQLLFDKWYDITSWWMHLEFMGGIDMFIYPSQTFVLELHFENDSEFFKKNILEKIGGEQNYRNKYVLCHKEYPINKFLNEEDKEKAFVELDEEVQCRILWYIYADNLEMIKIIDNCISNTSIVNINRIQNYYRDAIQNKTWPIQDVWTYYPNYLVIDQNESRKEGFAIDIDCRQLGIITISCFRRNDSIYNYFDKREVINDGKFAFNYDVKSERYIRVITFKGERSEELCIMNTINQLLNFLYK